MARHRQQGGAPEDCKNSSSKKSGTARQQQSLGDYQ